MAVWWITVRPVAPDAVAAATAWQALAGLLRRLGAEAWWERAFVGGVAPGRQARSSADLPGDPAWVVVATGAEALVGIQVVAVMQGRVRRELDGRMRLVAVGARRWGMLHGLCVCRTGDADEDFARGFGALEADLAGTGLAGAGILRTWWWVGDILGCYGALNRQRARWLAGRHGGLDEAPVSTAVGVADNGARCRLDCLVCDRPVERRWSRTATQGSAFGYGSSFVRLSRTLLPGGPAVLVSGTAAIASDGRSQRVGDPAAQTALARRHAMTAMRSGAGSWRQGLQGAFYHASPEALHAWRSRSREPWMLEVPAIICREDLSCEIEVAG